MFIKRVLCKATGRPDSAPVCRWVDQRLIRDEMIGLCGSDAFALDLFLISVADAKGLSEYSDHAIVSRLRFDACRLSQARCELLQGGLIAFEKPAFTKCWRWMDRRHPR